MEDSGVKGEDKIQQERDKLVKEQAKAAQLKWT